ncbi:MAG: nucleoside hydrolase, partial [Anaerolineae bacterium]
ALPDPVAMSVAIDRTICTSLGHYYVDVETTSELTRGMTVVDELRVTNHEPNIEVCKAIDIPRWKETLYRALC